MRVEGSSGLFAEEDGGAVRIGWGEADWLGPATAIEGAGASWSFAAEGDAVVLSLTHGSGGSGLGSGTFAEPRAGLAFRPSARAEGGCPDGMTAFGFQYMEFALPIKAGPALDDFFLLDFRPPVVVPLLLVAPDLRTLLVGPLDWFHEQVVVPPGGERQGLRIGWHGDLDEVPAGFTTRTAFVPGADPVAAVERWAELVRGGRPLERPSPYRDVLGSHLSYWTDNGAAYWYRTEAPRSVTETVVDAVDALRDQDLPVRAVQLDSWFYPHVELRPFDTEAWEVPPTGLVRWDARDDILPDGMAGIAAALGDPPLVTHVRHLSATSPYVELFDCWVDGAYAHPKGADYYEALLDQAAAWGVTTFEHDWLVECFVGVRGLREAPGRARAWQEGIDRAAGERGMTLQWCMGTPADMLQAASLPNVTSVRTSGDHGYLVSAGVLWTWFCYTNVLARALGLWPFKDVFRTDHDRPDESLVEALLSALSGGPVGVGDRIGATDAAVVRATCRADGLLVKPDAPIAAIARCFAAHAVFAGRHMVATTHSDHPAGRWVYALAFNPRERELREAEEVSAAELGAGDDHAVWDWRHGAFLDPGAWPLALGPEVWEYRVLCPRTPSGIAVVGDASVFATAGQGRIRDVTATADGVRLVLLGAGETVTVTGHAPGPVAATVTTPDGTVEVAVTAADDGRFDVDVPVGPLGWTRLDLRPDPNRV